VARRSGGARPISGPPNRAAGAQIDTIAADLEPTADDATGGKVQPRPGAADFNLLAPRKPEPFLDEGVVQDDGDVFELLIKESRTRERDRHAHHLRVRPGEIHGADSGWRSRVLGAKAHLENLNDLTGHFDAQRVGDGIVVRAQSGRRERVRHVAHLIPVPQPDDLGKVVLHDPEVIAMVLDVRWQEERITPAEDQLLAVVWRAPVDFERYLVRLHHLGRIGESLADLRQKGERSHGGRRVVSQAGVRQLSRAKLGCPRHERGHAGVVPVLRGRRDSHSRHQHHGDESGAGRAESKHVREVSRGSTARSRNRPDREGVTW
jgi:hypothetical protein